MSTTASTSYTPATAAFSVADLGSRISGTNIGLNNSVAAVNTAYLGGVDDDRGRGIAVDSPGDAFVAEIAP